MLTYEQAREKLLAAAQPVEEVRHVPLLAAAGLDVAPLHTGVAVGDGEN